MNAKDYTDEFIRRTLDYTSWIEKAEHLLEAANLLEPRIEKLRTEVQNGGFITEHYFTTYFMLASYAVENLLKALYIKLNADSVKRALEEKKRLPKEIVGHDLNQLAQKLRVINREWGEEALLRKLSRCAVWYGRYPIPIEASQLDYSYKSESEDLHFFFLQYGSDDVKEIQGFISRVRSMLRGSA
jgi:hypothetical protein